MSYLNNLIIHTLSDLLPKGTYKYLLSPKSRLIVNTEVDFASHLPSFFKPLSRKAKFIYFFMLLLARNKVVWKMFPQLVDKDLKDYSQNFSGHVVYCIYTGRVGQENNLSVLSLFNGNLWITKIFPSTRKAAADRELLSRDYELVHTKLLAERNIEILQIDALISENFVMLRSQFHEGSTPITSREHYVAVKEYLLQSNYVGQTSAVKLFEFVDRHQPNLKDYFNGTYLDLKDVLINCSLQHGDFAPWNVKRLANRRYLLIDWEEAENLPEYFDYVYFELRSRKVKFFVDDLVIQIEIILKELLVIDDRVIRSLCIAYISIYSRKGYLLKDV